MRNRSSVKWIGEILKCRCTTLSICDLTEGHWVFLHLVYFITRGDKSREIEFERYRRRIRICRHISGPLICLTKILRAAHTFSYSGSIRLAIGSLEWRVRRTEIHGGDECLLTQVVRRTRALLADGMYDGLLWTLKRETHAPRSGHPNGSPSSGAATFSVDAFTPTVLHVLLSFFLRLNA